jgi:hypothetical protein
MSYEETWLPPCAICKESVNLEQSKTDEYGQAVHENCYVWTVALKKPRRNVIQMDAVYEWPSLASGAASYALAKAIPLPYSAEKGIVGNQPHLL